jgi:tripartite-type tricarboxylate transporter receptor subunit TctC
MQLIVPYGREGASDRVARVMAAGLAARRGEPVPIENRPGGGTVPGTLAAAQAPADARTLLLVTVTNYCIAPLLDPALPFAPQRDFEILAVCGDAPNVLAVPPCLGVDSVAALVATARARPGALAFASAGAGQTIHLCGAVFRALAGIDIRHVPYAQGSAAAYDDLRAGRVHLMFDSLIGALPDLRSGALRALAVVAPARVATLPEVPTMAECGFGAFAAPIWLGLAIRAGAPAAERERLRADLAALMGDASVRAALGAIGLTPWAAGALPADFPQSSIDAWRRNVALAGLNP